VNLTNTVGVSKWVQKGHAHSKMGVMPALKNSKSHLENALTKQCKSRDQNDADRLWEKGQNKNEKKSIFEKIAHFLPI
jgi:hypothetical protein